MNEKEPSVDQVLSQQRDSSDSIPVQVRLIRPTSKLPFHGSDHAAGYDLYADINKALRIMPGAQVVVPAGIELAIPVGWYGRIADRSGWAANHGITTFAGVVDSDFRGEVKIVISNQGAFEKVIEPGDRMAQIIFERYYPARFEEVLILPESQRAKAGLGSTGNK
jgi:dUTP pyrophosphatase